MMFALVNLVLVAALFASMFALQTWGRHLGEQHWKSDPDSERATSAAETAVFALLGLILAFMFSGAASRFETRRDQIVEEANAIGTAWLRIDVLPADRQPPIRELFRKYLDSRLERYRSVGDAEATAAASARSLALQNEIWSAAMAAADAAGQVPPYTVVLPSLNDMFDIVTTREAAALKHSPAAVFVMLAVLALIASLFAGYGMARKQRSRIHSFGFATVMAMAIYVIIDLEFPRVGFIRIDSADVLLVEVRAAMN